MPKHSMLIACLLLSVSAVAGDQLMRWGVTSATRSAMPAADHRQAATSMMPVSLLGSAIAMGAQHRLDRSGATGWAEPSVAARD